MEWSFRAPSANWEPVSLDQAGRAVAWVWYRPASAPNGLIILVPASVIAEPQFAARVTVRNLLVAAALDPAQAIGWWVNGYHFDAAGGNSPMLDLLLPPSPPDGQVHLTVWMELPQPAPLPAVWPGDQSAPLATAIPAAHQILHPSGGSASVAEERWFAAIDSCWNAIRQLEAKVGAVRKQLDQAVSRLNSLNRDLTPEERRAADNKDAKDWQDARRWLRDSLASLSRSIKEIDMGTTSGAGQRHRFEDLYRQYVAPRVPFAGLEQAVIEFESHAKILQNVVTSAQTGLTRAGRDAEQRASGLLTRIGAKSRSNRRKE